MPEIVFAHWTLDVDVEATTAAYAQIQSGSPEVCGCLPCRNFSASRNRTFPDAIRSFLRLAAIPIDREAEIYHCGKVESGLHLYGGWFHFVGRIVSGADAYVPHDAQSWRFDLHDFSSIASAGVSSKTALVDPAFKDEAVLQLEFSVEIPWVLHAPEMD